MFQLTVTGTAVLHYLYFIVTVKYLPLKLNSQVGFSRDFILWTRGHSPQSANSNYSAQAPVTCKAWFPFRSNATHAMNARKVRDRRNDRSWRNDHNAMIEAVVIALAAFVAFRTLRALRWMETTFNAVWLTVGEVVLRRDIQTALWLRVRVNSQAHLGANQRSLHTWRHDRLVPRRMACWRHRQVIPVTSFIVFKSQEQRTRTRHWCNESQV